MIDAFESSARIWPDRVFLTFFDNRTLASNSQRRGGREARALPVQYTYRQARLISSALGRKLLAQGARPGDAILVDLPNGPEFLFLVLAAAYAGIVLVITDGKAEDTLARKLELERNGMRVAMEIDQARAAKLVPRMKPTSDEVALVSRIYAPKRERSIMGEREDVVQDTVHFAERQGHVSPGKTGVVFLQSDSSKHSKAVPLTWAQIMDAAYSMNALLDEMVPKQAIQERLPFSTEPVSTKGNYSWQCVLPLCKIDGFQTLTRAVVSQSPVRLFESFDAETALHDANENSGMQIALSNRMLQDMLTVEEWRYDLAGDFASQSRIREYRCILLNNLPNAALFERILEERPNVYASYGRAEYSGPVAAAAINTEFVGGLTFAPGYTARIIDDGSWQPGVGTLVLDGPGVFDGYLSAKAAFTVDRWFITGDQAALHDGKLYMKIAQRSVQSSASNTGPQVAVTSGGETPSSLGASNAVASTGAAVNAGTGVEPGAGASAARSAKAKMAADVGQVDAFTSRIQVRKVVIRRISLPFTVPFRTARGVLDGRESLVVQVYDSVGRCGLGECITLGAGWRNSETIEADERVIRQHLAPALSDFTISHPREVSQLFSQLSIAADHPMATSALECAVWDLFGQATCQPLWKLINEEYERFWNAMGMGAQYKKLQRFAQIDGDNALVAAGATVGMGSDNEALANCGQAVRSGYKHLKLKVAPGKGLEVVRSVRRAYPNMLITLDANRSFADRDMDELRAYDSLGVGWIEEPFSGGTDPIAHIAQMQPRFRTPLCIDESFTNATEAERIFQFPSIRCVAIKVGKFGGIWPALAFVARAKVTGRVVWMGGTYDTGISRRVSAAFETLPDMVIPGDIGSTSRLFETDITDPEYAASRGFVMLNSKGNEWGLGCKLNEDAMSRVEVARSVVE